MNRTRSEPRYVFVQRPRCPSCGSVDLKTQRSLPEQSDGSKARCVKCRTCGENFIVVHEIVIQNLD